MTLNPNSHCHSTGIGGGEGGVRLFGVCLTDRSIFIKKSSSMGNLISNQYSPSDLPEGYHSDDPANGSAAFHRARRKRGIPWTEEEHMKFLCGLQKLGKGDWRGISRNYVPSRTPTQVASHAQKYFIRQSNAARKKKRSSLFDMTTNMQAFSTSTPEQCNSQSAKNCEKHVVSSSHVTAGIDSSLPCLSLTLKPAFMPLPFRLWPPNASSDEAALPVVRYEPVKEMELSQSSLHHSPGDRSINH